MKNEYYSTLNPGLVLARFKQISQLRPYETNKKLDNSCSYLSHTQSSLMHVAQVEHGLCTVLFFGRPPVVKCCCFIINICSITIVMVITNFNSCCCVSFGRKKLEKKHIYREKFSLVASRSAC